MNLPAQIPTLSVPDYLEGEQESPIRHEYVAGRVVAMAGAGEAHNRIAGNLFFHLRSATRGTPCGVFVSDMKVRVATHDAFYYPDVVLTCDPTDRESLYKASPCLIAEVLSPSTETIDRREKLLAYRALTALRYYLLVAQDRRLVEVYQRGADGSWHYQAIEDGELAFACGDLDIRFTLADLYEDVVLPA
ncbi:Uma2 family endonuclease [uncultured Thiodictyon sp.]|uniref:Uma2 family endonuclease n=1 Tax=uncultured Thiodictyon sp. TaxID=1846217 RepID=UPI0025F39732|nr:Uma2 family endonuclease [uncultured Thiodictyon sp.]